MHLWGHLYPCFGPLMMSALGFKARLDPFACLLYCQHGMGASDSPLVLHLFGRQHWWGSRSGSFVREALFCLFKSSQCILPVNTANFSVKKIVNTVGESLSEGVSLTENSLCRDPYWTETSPLRRPPWTET